MTQSKILKGSLILGIIIVLNLFFNYTLSLIYKEPVFNNFCINSQIVVLPQDKQECLVGGGQWTENVNYGQPVPVYGTKPAGYCDEQFTCRQNYTEAQKVYDRNVFVTLVILGAICVAIGTFLKSNAVVGTALSLAGVFSFIIASMRYWSSANSFIKVIILAIALALLIWVAIKKFKNQ